MSADARYFADAARSAIAERRAAEAAKARLKPPLLPLSRRPAC